MDTFQDIHFKGVFRTYQQRVLDNAHRYLSDGKINIVAAPGSGKTVLGLELIRRAGNACLILSPTTAIRDQWGQRFCSMFLDDPAKFDELFSYDLHNIKLINCITYQALYSAMKRTDEPDGETDPDQTDLIKIIRENRVKTICLDEAHHLKNEWHKALENFIALLEGEIQLISLTATPPYDAEESEWNRYVALCGEIDEEIFIPELIAQNTLCPHQDYIYFNYPDKEETAVFDTYRRNAAAAVAEISEQPFLRDICNRLNAEKDFDKLFSFAKEYIALLSLLKEAGLPVEKRLIRALTARQGLPSLRPQYAETAIRFLLEGDLTDESQKEQIVSILKKYGVYEKCRVQLLPGETIRRALASSVGKLNSIREIALHEKQNLGNSLRMLILTDHIKKESLRKIGSEETFTSVNVVSIFETLRRADPSLNIAVLSGTLVILPEDTDLCTVRHEKHKIEGTRYCTFDIEGGNAGSVRSVTKLFESGKIDILVGTKSLLGEGWDSPCINALILASFVGSFVLSNQMRGRAIRIDANDPQKTANIWHLVTVEPDYLFADKLPQKIQRYLSRDENELTSCDFETLKRRFDSFMGPNYATGKIESGIERISAVAPPYDRQGIAKINAEMLSLAAQRDCVREKWQNEVCNTKFEVSLESTVPKEDRVPVFTFLNFGLIFFLTIIQIVLLNSLIQNLYLVNTPRAILAFLLCAVMAYFLYRLVRKFLLHINPARSIRALGEAVYQTLRDCGIISPAAKVETEKKKNVEYIRISLRNASVHDQNVFNTAIRELLSPIENPRYILVRRNYFGSYDTVCSYACPTVIGKKKEYAEILSQNLHACAEKFTLVYTRTENGRNFILRCRKRSYITYNRKVTDKKYKITHWE